MKGDHQIDSLSEKALGEGGCCNGKSQSNVNTSVSANTTIVVVYVEYIACVSILMISESNGPILHQYGKKCDGISKLRLFKNASLVPLIASFPGSETGSKS